MHEKRATLLLQIEGTELLVLSISGCNRTALPAAVACQMELFLMLGKERGAVADADDAGLRQLPAHELVHLLLARLVEGRRRFVEEDPVGLDEEDAGKGEALLLAEREDAAPVVDIIEARDKVRQADLTQDFLEVFFRPRGTQRIVEIWRRLPSGR